jgi:hypothetical protein
MVSNPCGKSKVHSFLQWIILAICTFENRTGMAINPNSFKPNAFRTCLYLFIRGVIRLNLMQRSFKGWFNSFHVDGTCLQIYLSKSINWSHYLTARPNNLTISDVLNVKECPYLPAGTSFFALTSLLIVVLLRPQRKHTSAVRTSGSLGSGFTTGCVMPSRNSSLNSSLKSPTPHGAFPWSVQRSAQILAS